MSPPPTRSPATGDEPASSDATRVIQGDSSPQSGDDHEVRVVGLELHRIIVGVCPDGAICDDAEERELCAGRGACLAHRLHDTRVRAAVDDVEAQLLAEWHDDGFEQLLSVGNSAPASRWALPTTTGTMRASVALRVGGARQADHPGARHGPFVPCGRVP